MKNYFRAIALTPVVMILLLIITIGPNSSLSQAASEYQLWYFSQNRTLLEELQIWFGLIGQVLLLVSTIGVLFFLDWARILYFIAAILLIFPQYAETAVLIHGWQPILSDIGAISMGGALALMWTSPISRKFEHEQPNQSSNSTGAKNAPSS